MRALAISFCTSVWLTSAAFAQTVDLVCDGKFSDYSGAAVRDVSVNGVLFRIDLPRSKIVVLSGLKVADGFHEIYVNAERHISFRISENATGFLNRWTGEFSIARSKGEAFDWLFSGSCKPGKRIF